MGEPSFKFGPASLALQLLISALTAISSGLGQFTLTRARTRKGKEMAKNQNNQVHRRAAKAAGKADGQPSAFDEKTPPKVKGTVDQGIQLPKSVKGKG